MCGNRRAAILAAQRVEFVLYGLVAHIRDDLKHRDARFRRLTPESFLRGDVSKMRATLGQLAQAYGDTFLLPADDLAAFVKKRNLIAHDYWRTAKARIRGAETLQDPMAYIQDFLADCARLERVLRGLLATFRRAAAKNAGDENQAQLTADDLACMDEYHEHARRYLFKQQPQSSPVADNHVGHS